MAISKQSIIKIIEQNILECLFFLLIEKTFNLIKSNEKKMSGKKQNKKVDHHIPRKSYTPQS